MMNPEIKQRWIDALLSGEYQQVRECLHVYENEQHKFCCLGVLTDLYLKEHNLEWTEQSLAEGSSYFLHQNNCVNLSEDVMKWSGIGDECGKYDRYEPTLIEYALTSDNDAGLSFQEISEIIKEKF